MLLFLVIGLTVFSKRKNRIIVHAEAGNKYDVFTKNIRYVNFDSSMKSVNESWTVKLITVYLLIKILKMLKTTFILICTIATTVLLSSCNEELIIAKQNPKIDTLYYSLWNSANIKSQRNISCSNT